MSLLVRIGKERAGHVAHITSYRCNRPKLLEWQIGTHRLTGGPYSSYILCAKESLTHSMSALDWARVASRTPHNQALTLICQVC